MKRLVLIALCAAAVGCADQRASPVPAPEPSVANFLIRLFVSSHVTTSLMAWLPVPDRGAAVGALAALEPGAGADARVRALYGLTKQEAAAI